MTDSRHRSDASSCWSIPSPVLAAAQAPACVSANRLRPASASSGPRSNSRPSRCSTSQPRHPGGREKSQPNCTCVLPSGRLLTLRCSWLMIPNGTETSTSTLCRSGVTRITVVTARQRLQNARDEKYKRCPACSGPSGLAASKRAVDQSVHRRGSISSDQTRSIGALIVAAGQTDTVMPKPV
jgi:hypothetical protein